MSKSCLFWRVVGFAVIVVGLIGIWYEIGSRNPSLSFSSTACADDVATPPVAKTHMDDFLKLPKLDFQPLHGGLGIQRAKVPGGWLIITPGLKLGRDPQAPQSNSTIFFPDPEHKWVGGNLDIQNLNCGGLGIQRAKVPGGWIIITPSLTFNGDPDYRNISTNFYSDPEHKWDGGNSTDEK